MTDRTGRDVSRAAPTGGADLAAVGLRKSFGAVEVLADVSLTVRAGETYGLLGPSGCGKSTLLRIMAGFEAADAGRVEVGGAEVSGPSPQRGMVAQAGTLFPWLTLHDNLAFGPRAAGRSDVEGIVEDLLRATGLDGFAGALPRQLSGGMQQRAAIAQVLANAPPVLLLDEPFGALDAQTRLRMHEWLRTVLSARSTTTLLVTHDVDEALLLSDRLGLLSARPARVVEEIPVPFAGARGRQTLADPAFVRMKATILDRVLAA